MRSHVEGRNINIVGYTDAQVLPVEEDIGDDGIVPAVEDSASDREQSGIAVFTLEIFDIGTKDNFVKRALQRGQGHRLQRHVGREGNARDKVHVVAHRQALGSGAKRFLRLVEVGGGNAQLERVGLVRTVTPEESRATVEVELLSGQELFAGAKSRVIMVVLKLFIPATGREVEKVVEHAGVGPDADLVVVLATNVFNERCRNHSLCRSIAHIAGLEGVDGPADGEQFLPAVIFVECSVGANAESEVGFSDRKPLCALVAADAEDAVKCSRQRWIHGDWSRVELGVVMILCPQSENRHAQGQQQREKARTAPVFGSLFEWRTNHRLKVLGLKCYQIRHKYQ